MKNKIALIGLSLSLNFGLISSQPGVQYESHSSLSDFAKTVLESQAEVFGKNVAGASGFSSEEEAILSVHEILKFRWKGSKKEDLLLLSEVLVKSSVQAQIDPLLVLGMIHTESSFRPNRVGGVGEIGLMQIRPETAEWLCKKLKKKFKGREELFKPQYNVEVGIAYLGYLRTSMNKDGNHFISAYNMGPRNVRKLASLGKRPVVYYSKVVASYGLIQTTLEKSQTLAQAD